MTVRPKLMIGAGIAIAGLGLIGCRRRGDLHHAGSGSTSITSGDLGLSLNGANQSTLLLGVDANHLGSQLRADQQGTWCSRTPAAWTWLHLSQYQRDRLRRGRRCSSGAKPSACSWTDETNGGKLIYDGSLCSLAGDRQSSQKYGQARLRHPTAHAGVGDQLPDTLQVGQSIHYRLLIQPQDHAEGLPSSAQNMRTSVNLVFSGFDY